MSLERAQSALSAFGAADRIHLFDVSSATVALAAQALGCEEARIAKSLTFRLGERILLIVAAGDAKVANPAYKARFEGKAVMLTPQEAETLVGHAVGGVCPFGVEPGVELYLDESLRRFATVFPAAGTANSAIELTLEELERFTGYPQWVDVCKGWKEEGA